MAVHRVNTNNSGDTSLSTSATDPSLNLELYGRNLAYSLGFEKPLSRQFSLGIAGSYHYFTFGSASYSATLLTPYVTFYQGRRHRLFETAGMILGFSSFHYHGTNLSTDSEGNTTLVDAPEQTFSGVGYIPHGGLGYEFRSNGGFIFRSTAYLFYIPSTDYSVAQLYPWLGLTLGKTI